MTWSQENCLINDRRLTCERWGRGFATSLLFLAFGDENIFAYAYEALFRSREGAFFSGQKVFSMVSALWRSTAHTFHSVLFAALRQSPGRTRVFSGPPPFFRRVVKSKGYLHGFSSMERHCSYIHFFRRLRRGSLGGETGEPPLFLYGVTAFFLRASGIFTAI